jgi:hypothetical protein
MAVITSGSFAKALYPGVNSWWGQAYDEWAEEYTDLFNKVSSKRAYEEDVQFTGLGLAAIKREGDAVTFDSMQQGFLTRYVPVNYGLGFVITKEMVEDDLYGVIGKKRARSLAFSMRQTKEQVAANVYNRAFNPSFTGGDGVELLSAAHLNYTGGTFSNELATAADLSEAALEQSCIDIAKMENDRGLAISLSGDCLIVPVDLMFEAERILGSPYRVGTGDNDVNALRSMGKFPGGVKVNHYLTDTDAFFIRTNLREDGLKYVERKAVAFTVDNEFDTENAKFKATERYAFGWTDPRALYGSPGA